jgi:hypothetical protein
VELGREDDEDEEEEERPLETVGNIFATFDSIRFSYGNDRRIILL